MHKRSLIQDQTSRREAKPREPGHQVTSVVYDWKCDNDQGYRTILIYDENGVFLGTRYTDRTA